MKYTNDRVPLRFDGGVEVSRPWLSADQHRAQRVLRKHASEPVQCLCTPSGVPMHVVCRGGSFHLATMPGRAHHHALSCPSYRPDRKTSGLKHYDRSAYTLTAQNQNIFVSSSPVGVPPFSHFTPSAVLQLLWDLAGLTVCTPKILAKRQYFLVSRSLADVCAGFRINGDSMRPYIPLAFTDPRFCRYLVGGVRRICHGRYGNAIHLSADRDHTFWVDQKEWSNSALSEVFGPFDDPRWQRGYFIISRLFSTRHGNFRLFDSGLLRVNRSFLPVTVADEGFLQGLVDANRRFFVCQRYDAIGDDRIPLVVLIDRDEPLYLYSGQPF